MTTYETLFITVPTLTEEEEQTVTDRLAAIVTDGGGNLVFRDRMGRRRLAYPIEEHDDGVYTRLLYDSEPAVPKELERRGRLADSVLRLLTVRLEEEWAADAKVQAVREAERRAEAEAQAKLDAERAAADAEKAAAEAAAAAAAAAAEPSAADAGAETPVETAPVAESPEAPGTGADAVDTADVPEKSDADTA